MVESDTTVTQSDDSDVPRDNGPQYHHSLFENFTNDVLDPNAPSLHLLNDDCIYLILSHFDVVDLIKLCGICRRMYNLCVNKLSMVKTLELNPTFSIFRLNKSLSKSNFISVLLLTKSLVYLDVSQSSLQLDFASCKAIADCCPNLVQLNLSKMKINRKIAKCLSLHLPPKLNTLILNGCVSLKEKCLKNVLINAKNIEKLDLSYNHRINGQCLTKHLTHNKMKHLNFTECYNLKPTVIEFILRNYSETLEYLNVSFCPRNILDGVLMTDMPILSNMKTFIVASTSQDVPTEYSLSMYLSRMPNLEHLDVSFNHGRKSNDFFSSILHFCPKIRYLNISHCMIASAMQLSELPNLKALKELYIDGLPDNFEYEMLTKDILSRCTELEVLSLQASFMDDDDIFVVISNSKKLKSLDIRSSLLNVNGNFINKCEFLDRTSILEVFVQDTFIEAEDFPSIPPFLKINFSLHINGEGNGFFGEFLNEFDMFDDFEDLEDDGFEDDDDDYWDGGYVDEALQFPGFDGHFPNYDEYNNEAEYNNFEEYGNFIEHGHDDGDWPNVVEEAVEEHLLHHAMEGHNNVEVYNNVEDYDNDEEYLNNID